MTRDQHRRDELVTLREWAQATGRAYNTVSRKCVTELTSLSLPPGRPGRAPEDLAKPCTVGRNSTSG